MADLTAYYNEIKDEKQKLDEQFPDGFLFVTAVRNVSKGNRTGGTVTEVTTAAAAKHLVNITARISTPAEIEAFKQQCEAFAHRMNAAEQTRNWQRNGQRFINLVQGPR
jgi:hypothetical protein